MAIVRGGHYTGRPWRGQETLGGALDRALERRLLDGAAELGVQLSAHAVEQLGRYLELLRQWNRRINLTAVDAPAQIVDRHFLDSLAVAPLLRPGTLVDVGAGAGFPGAVLAVARPDLAVTCIDGVHKKVAFLQTLRRELGIALEALAVRDEQLVRDGRRFDAAVSRATWDPQEWLAHGALLVSPGGRLIAMPAGDHPPLVPPPSFNPLPVRRYAVDGAARRIEVFEAFD
jgi:16S rRNA (guanine527-N7)-methyltransferase